MKLQVIRSKSVETQGRIRKTETTYYNLKVIAKLTKDEENLLSKYNYLEQTFYVAAVDEVVGINQGEGDEWRGGAHTTIQKLQSGVEWSCTALYVQLTRIPEAIGQKIVQFLGEVSAMEDWGGEEMIVLGEGG